MQCDILLYCIAGDWKASALKEDIWAETVKEGGRRFMAAWRIWGRHGKALAEEEIRQYWGSGSCTPHRSTSEATPVGPVDELKESCTGPTYYF